MKTLKSLLSDHYKDQSLPEGTANRLQTLTLADLGVSPIRRGGMRPWIRGLIASGLVLLVFSAGFAVSQVTGALGGLGSSDNAEGIALVEHPDLVAVNIEADWCLRSPIIAPLFAELVHEYGDRPILFVTMDITDDQARQQSQYLASNLEISGVFDAPFESGMIKLIDRSQGKILATLTSETQASMMEGLLAEALNDRLENSSKK